MKSFTIRLPKQNIDPTGNLKNRILNAVKEKLPFARWHGIHTPENPAYDIAYAGPEDLLCFGINRNAEFSALNKKYYKPTCPIDCECTCPFANKAFKLRQYDASTELDLALERLNKFAKALKEEEKECDFMYRGMPVRIYQKFIQVGNTIIPIDEMHTFKTKKENAPIINIIVNFSKTEIVNTYINELDDFE